MKTKISLIFFLFILLCEKIGFCSEDIKKYEFKSKNQINNKTNFIKKISSFNEVDFDGFIEDKNNLIIFDIDHTILKPSKLYEQYYFSNDKKCLEKVGEIRNLYGDQIDQNIIIGKIIKKMKTQIIETDIIEKIEFLKKNNIPCIAITGIPSGFNFGLGDTIQNWRFVNLKNLGIEFSFNDLSFVLNSSGYRRPIFFNGIIFTDNESKGNALKFFLEKINHIYGLDKKHFLNQIKLNNLQNYKDLSLKPKRIIMFDDHEAFLKNVSETCVELGIEFYGFHYKPYEISDWSEESEREFQEEIKGF